MKSGDKERRWRVLESQYLHKRPWLTVRLEKLQMPNGKVVPEYYVLEYPDWINVIAITEAKEFVMVKQYRPGIGKSFYELCAGVCEQDDSSPLEAAKRELLEETGYGGGIWREFLHIAPNASASNNWSHCFIAKNVKKISKQLLDESEDLTVHLFSFQQVKKLLERGNIVQATMVAPLWKFVAKYNI